MADADRLRTSYLIKRVELLVRTRLETALRDLGVTTGQYAVLSLLVSMPEVSSAELSRAVGVTPQTMAETILSFERDALIQREQSQVHKRVLKITLTPKGRALLKSCETRANAIEQDLFAGLTADDIPQLRLLLNAILQHADSAQS